MKLWILFIAAMIVSRKAEKILDYCWIKFFQHVIQPVWNMVGPKPGGKIWALVNYCNRLRKVS